MSILAMTCSVLHGNRFPWVLVDEFVFGCHGMWARMLVANVNPAGTALEWCVVDDDGTPPGLVTPRGCKLRAATGWQGAL